MCPGRAKSAGAEVGLASARMVAARSTEDTPVVVPARRSTDTVNAVRCDSLLTGTICGRSSRASAASSIGTQMMPLVWRIMNATASAVACSAAMMRSPSFSRSSSSMTITIRPARSSASISPTELSGAAAGAVVAFPERGRIFDMTEDASAREIIIPDTPPRPGGALSGSVRAVWLWQERQHRLLERLHGGGVSGKQPYTHDTLRIDDPGHRHCDRRSEIVHLCRRRQGRRVAEALHYAYYRVAVLSVVDTHAEEFESLCAVAPVKGVELRHLGAAG